MMVCKTNSENVVVQKGRDRIMQHGLAAGYKLRRRRYFFGPSAARRLLAWPTNALRYACSCNPGQRNARLRVQDKYIVGVKTRAGVPIPPVEENARYMQQRRKGRHTNATLIPGKSCRRRSQTFRPEVSPYSREKLFPHPRPRPHQCSRPSQLLSPSPQATHISHRFSFHSYTLCAVRFSVIIHFFFFPKSFRFYSYRTSRYWFTV